MEVPNSISASDFHLWGLIFIWDLIWRNVWLPLDFLLITNVSAIFSFTRHPAHSFLILNPHLLYLDLNFYFAGWFLRGIFLFYWLNTQIFLLFNSIIANVLTCPFFGPNSFQANFFICIIIFISDCWLPAAVSQRNFPQRSFFPPHMETFTNNAAHSFLYIFSIFVGKKIMLFLFLFFFFFPLFIALAYDILFQGSGKKITEDPILSCSIFTPKFFYIRLWLCWSVSAWVAQSLQYVYAKRLMWNFLLLILIFPSFVFGLKLPTFQPPRACWWNHISLLGRNMRGDILR